MYLEENGNRRWESRLETSMSVTGWRVAYDTVELSSV